MLDGLLRRRGEYTLTEWAERGWLSSVPELLPFEIAFLVFPYTRINEDEEPERYDRVKKDFLTLCGAIMDAVEFGHLPPITINLYDYKPLFRCSMPGSAEVEAYSEFLSLGDYGRYKTALTWMYARQRIPTECDYKRIPIPVIGREDFKAWLVDAGEWPVQAECLLSKWFEEEEGEEVEPPAAPNKDETTLESAEDKRKHGRRAKQVNAFIEICNDIGIIKDKHGLFIIESVRTIRATCQKHDKYSNLFTSGWDDFWESDERKSIAINPNAHKYRGNLTVLD